MLSFGLRSAPKIFTALADTLEWCIAKEGVKYIYHYLDDFVVLGLPDSEQCGQNLHTLQLVCKDLGVPLAPEKQAGSTSTIEFLGIIIDTVRQELRLPNDKLERLKILLDPQQRGLLLKKRIGIAPRSIVSRLHSDSTRKSLSSQHYHSHPQR